MTEERQRRPVDSNRLYRYSTERLTEEHEQYCKFVEDYPPRSFPDVLGRHLSTEKALRDELHRREVKVRQPKWITRDKQPYERNVK